MVSSLDFPLWQNIFTAGFEGQYLWCLYKFQDDNILRWQYYLPLWWHYAYQYLRYGEQYCDFIPPSPGAAISEFPSAFHFLTHRHLKMFNSKNKSKFKCMNNIHWVSALVFHSRPPSTSKWLLISLFSYSSHFHWQFFPFLKLKYHCDDQKTLLCFSLGCRWPIVIHCQ